MPNPTVKPRASLLEAQQLRRQLVLGFSFAVFGAALAGGASWWDALYAVPAEDLIRVYRVHGCRCAFTWARALKENGFTVRVVELETLRDIRRQLAAPIELEGCHVGQYLTYFVEGHVAPAVLRTLAAKRPVARGISAAEIQQTAQPNQQINEAVLLFDQAGHSRRWSMAPQPLKKPHDNSM